MNGRLRGTVQPVTVAAVAALGKTASNVVYVTSST